MSDPSPSSSPVPTGWPRVLPDLLGGAEAGAAAVEEVAEAVRVEQRATARAVQIRIDAVAPLGEEEASLEECELWRLDVSLPRGRLRAEHGALLVRDLAEGGTAWSADVLEVDLDARVLLVRTSPGEVPPTGMVRLLPINFLRALHRLCSGPDLADARRDLGALLTAAAGQVVPDGPLAHDDLLAGRRSAPEAWRWPWAMVWGPPGTGKTHTLVQEVARILQDPGERVLVVSTTNQATDEVALRLGRRPGGVQRVGTLTVGPFREQGLLDLLPPPEGRLDLIEQQGRRLARARTEAQRARARVRLGRARAGLPRLRHLLADDHPRCVLTTAHGAISAVVSPEMEPFFGTRRAPFTTVVIDEAGLLSRAAVAAIGLLAARQVVLVGDPRQLSPICVAERSMPPTVKRWLAASAMEHAGTRQPYTQVLARQHRMHSDIGAIVSAFQYDCRVQDAEGVRGRPLPEALSGRLRGWPRGAWVVLDACEGMDLGSVSAQRGRRSSWERPAGIEAFERLVGRYPELGRVERGLFISPYVAQARAASRAIRALGLSDTWSASTVHAQQGSEADVVVFDLVRPGGWPLAEWKRLVNVALSRARHQLLVLAAAPDLEGQPGCQPLVDQLVRCRLTREGALQKLARADAQQQLLGRSSTTIDSEPRPATPPAPSTPRAVGRRDADPASMGVQIAQSRAARQAMTREQAQLVRRNLRDLGPRVVRGVAGSGKTIVMARWMAAELVEHADRQATIIFGNTALAPHLRRLVEQAWRVTLDRRDAEAPWERIHLVHIGDLLRGLLDEAGLPPPSEGRKYDYEAQARSLLGRDLSPRFGLLYLDEAQDLGHDTLGLLISLVEPAEDPEDPAASHLPVRVFYDNAQNVYRRRTPRWSEFGLDVRGRSAVLRESFRTTRQAMEFALDVVHALRPLDRDPDMRELIAPRTGPPLLELGPDGRWQAHYVVIDGQLPEVHLHPDRDAEDFAVADRVHRWLADGVAARDIRVLAPRKDRCEALATSLQAAGIDAVHARNTSLDNKDPRVVVTTPQSFKGYEAELVVVAGVEGFYARGAGRVLVEALYVALTRARTQLWVSGVRVEAGAPGWAVVEAVEGAGRG